MSFCCEFAKNGFCETFLLHFMLTLQKKTSNGERLSNEPSCGRFYQSFCS